MFNAVTENPHKLDYAPRHHWRRSRRTRLIFRVLTVLAMGAFCWKWGLIAYREAATFYWERQCMQYVASPQQVVCDFPSHASPFQASKDFTTFSMLDIGTAFVLTPPTCISGLNTLTRPTGYLTPFVGG